LRIPGTVRPRGDIQLVIIFSWVTWIKLRGLNSLETVTSEADEAIKFPCKFRTYCGKYNQRDRCYISTVCFMVSTPRSHGCSLDNFGGNFCKRFTVGLLRFFHIMHTHPPQLLFYKRPTSCHSLLNRGHLRAEERNVSDHTDGARLWPQNRCPCCYQVMGWCAILLKYNFGNRMAGWLRRSTEWSPYI